MVITWSIFQNNPVHLFVICCKTLQKLNEVPSIARVFTFIMPTELEALELKSHSLKLLCLDQVHLFVLQFALLE